MFLNRHSIALTLASAVAALLFAVVPADAESRGGGYSGGRGMGGYSGGMGGYSGGRGMSGGYYGGGRDWDGGRGYYGGFYPGIGIGIGGYGAYGYRGYSGYPYNGYSNYYAQPYYGTPSTTITIQPGDATVTQSGYAEPAAPDNRSRVEVRVPNDSAQVFFDGSPTQQTGADRVYMTPPLDPGKTYHYSIEAKWMENGKAMDQSRTVTVSPNQSAVVDFNNK